MVLRSLRACRWGVLIWSFSSPPALYVCPLPLLLVEGHQEQCALDFCMPFGVFHRGIDMMLPNWLDYRVQHSSSSESVPTLFLSILFGWIFVTSLGIPTDSLSNANSKFLSLPLEQKWHTSKGCAYFSTFSFSFFSVDELFSTLHLTCPCPPFRVPPLSPSSRGTKRCAKTAPNFQPMFF